MWRSQFLQLFSWGSGGIGLKFQFAFLWRLMMICSLSCAICISYFMMCLLKSFPPISIGMPLYYHIAGEYKTVYKPFVSYVCYKHFTHFVHDCIFYPRCLSLYNSLWQFDFIFIRSNLSFCCCFVVYAFGFLYLL